MLVFHRVETEIAFDQVKIGLLRHGLEVGHFINAEREKPRTVSRQLIAQS